MSEIRNASALQASIFRRLATGAAIGERARIEATAPDADELAADNQKMLTPRQCREQRQVFYFLRESRRRVQSMLSNEARRADDNVAAYQWRQNRPARKGAAA